MRKIFKSTKFWIVTFLLILICSFVVILIRHNSRSNYVIIYIEDNIFAQIPLTDEGTYPIESEFGKNVIEIKNGAVRVVSADCNNQICVKDGWVDAPNTPLICAPHHLIVLISDGENKAGEL